jgi:hypothetical protein
MPLPLFSETQRFRQPWLWFLLGGAGLFYLVTTFQALRESGAGGGATNLGALLAGMVLGGILLLFGSMRLDTRIDEGFLRYRLFPLHRTERTIPWASVERAWVREYRPIREYGGWGLRTGLRGGAVNIAGTTGLQLVLRDGRRLLIGTQRGPLLRTVLQALEARGVVQSSPPNGGR